MTDEALPGFTDVTPPVGPFIEKLLTQALISNNRAQLPPYRAIDGMATNAEVEALYAPWYRDSHAFLWHASLAHALIRLEESHPALAAGIAAEISDFLDAGDAYPEWIWEWAADRDMDPEQITKEAAESYEKWLAETPKRFTPSSEPVTPE